MDPAHPQHFVSKRTSIIFLSSPAVELRSQLLTQQPLLLSVVSGWDIFTLGLCNVAFPDSPRKSFFAFSAAQRIQT